MKRQTLAAIAIAVATILTFSGAFGHEFVNYDDDKYVTENVHVQDGLTGAGIRWAFTTGHAANWHPLTWLSHMLDATLFGADASGAHHAVNVFLHALNAALLFLFLSRATGSFWRCAVVAGLFALHPLRVESVAWVSERKDVLSSTFWMLTMLAYGRYVERPNAARYALVALSIALGLLAKPMLVTMPFVLLLLDIWPLRREQHGIGQLILEKVPLLAIALASSIVTAIVQSTGGAMSTTDTVALSSRLANALASYGVYLQQTVWPFELACFYPHAAIPPVQPLALTATIGGAVVALGTLLALRYRRIVPPLLVGWLWYLGTAVPVIGIVQVGQQAHADRYTYIPTIGVYIAAVWTLRHLLVRSEDRRKPLRITALIVIAGFAVVTWTQVRIWRDTEALWQHTLEVTNDNHVAHISLGVHYLRRAKQGPRKHRTLNLERAEREIRRANAINPDFHDCPLNLAVLEFELGDPKSAEQRLRGMLAISRPTREVELNLGTILMVSGRQDEAVPFFTSVTESDPNRQARAKAWASLGLIAQRSRQLDRAAELYGNALREVPTTLDGLNGLGTIAILRGDAAGALAKFRAALEIAPDRVQLLNNTAQLLATSRDDSVRNGREALALAQRLVELTGGENPRYLSTLAAAHAEVGDFRSAVRVQERAIQLGGGNPPAPVRAALEGYRQGRAWRQ